MRRIARNPEGRWVVLEDKVTVSVHATREEALVALAPAAKVRGECKHGQRSYYFQHDGPDFIEYGWTCREWFPPDDPYALKCSHKRVEGYVGAGQSCVMIGERQHPSGEWLATTWWHNRWGDYAPAIPERYWRD